MARRKADPTIRVKILIKGGHGGEVVKANTDYATGGPYHPDLYKNLSEGDTGPDASAREGLTRWPGDIVTYKASEAFGKPAVWGDVPGPTRQSFTGGSVRACITFG